ncbi:MAG: class I SAM-dependent methyltransferase [bacterium]
MTNQFHEANRKSWDAAASAGRGQVDNSKNWRACYEDASIFFLAEEMTWLLGISGKSVCVLGSGDNVAVFALAGMGASVTSVDISEEQLHIAAERAHEVNANINFIRADVTNLSEIPDNIFDLVYTGGHVAVWVSDLRAYYREAVRILKPGGKLIINEYHPFRRCMQYDNSYQYFNHGPFQFDNAEDIPYAEPGYLPSYEFHWTVSDFVNAVIDADAALLQLHEIGDEAECWESMNLAGLPRCLLLLAQKNI